MEFVGGFFNSPATWKKKRREIGSFSQFSLPPTKLDATKESPMPV